MLEGFKIRHLIEATLKDLLPTPAKWAKAWTNGLSEENDIHFDIYVGFSNGKLHLRIRHDTVFKSRNERKVILSA